ncbi:MAG TPA: hypothetical protein PKI03_12960 [Pseudomonadota bacterium]|nr:hypothetical protein [Pseudomonadota bacterium]
MSARFRKTWLAWAAAFSLGCSAGPMTSSTEDLGLGEPDASNPGALDQGSSLAALSDEFSASSLSGWSDLFPSLHSTLSLTQVTGQLSLAPVAVDQTHWYSDQHGPMIYKAVTGNFVVETQLRVGRQSDMAQAPRGQFSAGGFVVRDPQSVAPGSERWVMYNIGYQSGTVAREAKSTRVGSPASLSTLYLINSNSVLSGRLRVCRLGSMFHFFHQLTGEAGFVEEAYGSGTAPMGNGAGEATPGVVVGGVIRFDRPDLPATLQVGLIAGNWASPYETRAEFDYARFASATSLADCTRPLP